MTSPSGPVCGSSGAKPAGGPPGAAALVKDKECVREHKVQKEKDRYIVLYPDLHKCVVLKLHKLF
jgi:hypothetical protein